MDLFYSRQEIRRQSLALVGRTTDNLLGAPQLSQVNAILESAAQETAQHTKWTSTLRRASIPLFADQTAISFTQIENAYWMELAYPNQYHPGTYGTPADSFAPDLSTAPVFPIGPGGIHDVAYWDASQRTYYPLQKRIIPVDADQDRWTDNVAEATLNAQYSGQTGTELQATIDAAEAERESNRSRPTQYMVTASGIQIWPIPDKAYVIRVQYAIAPTWLGQSQTTGTAVDQMVLPIDGQAIIYNAVANLFAQDGDDYQASRYEKKFDLRIRALRARESSGEAVARDKEATYDNDVPDPRRILPQWQVGPRYR